MLLPGSFFYERRLRLIYWLVFVLVVFLGILMSVYAGNKAYQINRDNLISRVSTIAEVIDIQDLSSLSGSHDDLSNPAYDKLKKLLINIRSVNPDARFIYLNGLQNNNIIFFVDSELESSQDYSPPGQIYGEATPLMYEVLSGASNGFEIARDRWGLWASAFVPIYDKSNNVVVASVGMDVPGIKYVGDIVAYATPPILLSIIVLVFITTIQYILRREERFVSQKAEFVSIASHEIRSPLTAIRWASETLLSRRSTLIDEPSRSTISLILESSNSLISRVNNLLDMSALQALGSKAIHRRFVSLRLIIDDIFLTLKLVATSRRINLMIRSDFDQSLLIFCDPEQIRHVLINLISNALKYTKDESEVGISYERVGDFHEITVDDQGPGISKENMPKIFDGYFRTEDAREEKEGTGLGLYVARRIARTHGGDIVVNSEIGKGSRFTLRLPLK